MSMPKRLIKTYKRFKQEAYPFCEKLLDWIEEQNQTSCVSKRNPDCQWSHKRITLEGIWVYLQDDDDLLMMFANDMEVEVSNRIGKLGKRWEILVMVAFFYEADHWLKEIGDFRIYAGKYREEFLADLETQLKAIYERLLTMITENQFPINGWELGDRFVFFKPYKWK